MSKRRAASKLSERESKPTGRHSRWVFALLGLGTIAFYWASVGHGLTNWDDPDYVSNNPFAALGPSGLVAAFTRAFDGTWYPLTHAFYVALRLVHASDSVSHLTQVALFGLTVAALPIALEAFKVARPAAIATALLWAAHPLRVESVAWLANLKDTLGITLLVASVALFGTGRRRLSFATFVGALLSKSAFFGLGVVFPIIELVSGSDRRAALRRTWPWLLASVMTAALAGLLHLANPARPPGLGLGDRLATALWTPWWYLARVLVPIQPRAIYDFEAVHPGDARFWAALVLWIGLVLAAWRWKRVAVVAVIASAALAPVSGLVPLRFLVADRYTLVPALALFAGVGAGLAGRLSPRALWLGAAVLALPCAVSNLAYQRAWRDSVSLWEHAVALSPGHPTVRMNLADAYASANRYADARRETVALLERRGAEPRVLAQLYWLSAVVDQIPPEELESRANRLAQSGFATAAVLDEADWCLSRNYTSCADALLAYSPSVQVAPRGLRMRSALARREHRPLEAVDFAARAISGGEARATVELVYALADASRGEEALREAERPMPDPLSAALLRGARAYALNSLGRVDEARVESGAAIEAVRAITGPR